jgi:predicted DNA-binding transcriptional regulator AlpA
MKLLRPREAAKAMGISPGTLWRVRREDATFPQPFRVGPNCVAFDEAELVEWLKSRKMAHGERINDTGRNHSGRPKRQPTP